MKSVALVGELGDEEVVGLALEERPSVSPNTSVHH